MTLKEKYSKAANSFEICYQRVMENKDKDHINGKLLELTNKEMVKLK